MTPTVAEREILLKDFARALFKSDMDELYKVVAPSFAWRYHDGVSVSKTLIGAPAIAKHLAEQRVMFSVQRFEEVSYFHMPETSFMTFSVCETFRATGQKRLQCGVERYAFENGKIALKDVYRKPVETSAPIEAAEVDNTATHRNK